MSFLTKDEAENYLKGVRTQRDELNSQINSYRNNSRYDDDWIDGVYMCCLPPLFFSTNYGKPSLNGHIKESLKLDKEIIKVLAYIASTDLLI